VDRSSGLHEHGRHRRLCWISVWNGFGFAMTLNNCDAKAAIWSVVDERRREPTVADDAPLTSWGQRSFTEEPPGGES
jgi:hypothetical protein